MIFVFKIMCILSGTIFKWASNFKMIVPRFSRGKTFPETPAGTIVGFSWPGGCGHLKNCPEPYQYGYQTSIFSKLNLSPK